MHKLDDIVNEMIRGLFCKMRDITKDELISSRYEKAVAEKQAHLNAVKAEYTKAAENVNLLKEEVVKCIRGESEFSREMLASLIADGENRCCDLRENVQKAESDLESEETILRNLRDQYDELISWAKLYDNASHEAKKMIVNSLIKRVDVYEGYKLKVEFNFDLSQFFYGLDFSA